LGDIAQLQGDHTEARNLFHDSFSLHREIGHPQGTRGAILRLATLLEEQSELIRALGLLLKYHDTEKDDTADEDFKVRILALKSNLSEDEYQEARKLSRGKSVEEILED
jgi:hypothetical protein